MSLLNQEDSIAENKVLHKCVSALDGKSAVGYSLVLMAKTLVIVESPAKAKTIGKYLGKEYEVLASVGHVRDLPKSNKNAIDIAGGFIPHYVISPEKRGVIESIKKAAAKADEVLLATDPDREGEAIAWHIKEAVKLKKPKRVVFPDLFGKRYVTGFLPDECSHLHYASSWNANVKYGHLYLKHTSL